jgi:hypothetical protein
MSHLDEMNWYYCETTGGNLSVARVEKWRDDRLMDWSLRVIKWYTKYHGQFNTMLYQMYNGHSYEQPLIKVIYGERAIIRKIFK